GIRRVGIVSSGRYTSSVRLDDRETDAMADNSQTSTRKFLHEILTERDRHRGHPDSSSASPVFLEGDDPCCDRDRPRTE
ncbi:hypothetical protein, partial [Sinorhizobium meliloti]|uniref:hypothetical protein n=1 Tax=Rhizobium meliloti TaxID=382 RepID=UPI001AEC92BB